MVQASRGCLELLNFFILSLKLATIKGNPSCNVIPKGNKNSQKLNFYIMGVRNIEVLVGENEI